MVKYKSDKRIGHEFRNMKINEIKFTGNRSGFIDIYFPHGGESVAGGAKNVCDNFIIYYTGVVAFSYWYPNDIYWQLSMAVRNKSEDRK